MSFPAARQRLVGLGVALTVAAAVTLGYFYLRAPEATLVKVGDVAPELDLPSLRGSGTTRLSAFRGRAVLLTMFMSKCRICSDEIRQIERLHRAFLQKGLIVLGVSVDPDRASLERFAREKELTFLILEDFGGPAVRQAYGSYKMPEHYLIDPEGRVAAVYLGSVAWSSPEVLDAIRAVLPPPRPTPPPAP